MIVQMKGKKGLIFSTVPSLIYNYINFFTKSRRLSSLFAIQSTQRIREKNLSVKLIDILGFI